MPANEPPSHLRAAPREKVLALTFFFMLSIQSSTSRSSTTAALSPSAAGDARDGGDVAGASPTCMKSSFDDAGARPKRALASVGRSSPPSPPRCRCASPAHRSASTRRAGVDLRSPAATQAAAAAAAASTTAAAAVPALRPHPRCHPLPWWAVQRPRPLPALTACGQCQHPGRSGPSSNSLAFNSRPRLAPCTPVA